MSEKHIFNVYLDLETSAKLTATREALSKEFGIEVSQNKTIIYLINNHQISNKEQSNDKKE
jgi:hypothetical protein